jgi:hypothetical protein
MDVNCPTNLVTGNQSFELHSTVLICHLHAAQGVTLEHFFAVRL